MGARMAAKSAETTTSFLTPTSGAAPNGLPYLDWGQAAVQINRDGGSWNTTLATPITVTYAFRASGAPPAGAGVTGCQQFNAAQIQATEEALRLWSEVANISFVRVGSGTSGPGAYSNNATMVFANFVTGPAAFSAFAFTPDPAAMGAGFNEGDVWVNVSRDYDANPLAFPLGFHILAHEIGHTFGLLHPGVYDGGAAGGATYANDADHWQDTLQFTNMSYFSETNTGAYFGGSYSITPMMHDIAAAQRLYGVNTTTRTGATTYGFNANAGHAAFAITSPSQIAIFCIWDAGGTDTLDLSGFATHSEIDLREESFSSAGTDAVGTPLIGNISIARGAVIENAIGGAGGDTLIGNAVANHFTGNGGNDAIDGGAGVDVAAYALASAGASWARNLDGTWTVTAGVNGTDALTRVEFLDFTDRDVFLDRAARTFSGNGTSDVLFRRSDGVMASWEVTGTTLNAVALLPTAGAQWSVLGTGDVSGDGRDDVIWRRSDGLVYVWTMNGGAVSGAVALAGVGAAWSFLGMGDFNGDLTDDFAWRRTDGLVYLWQMNASAIAGAAAVTGLGAEWALEGFGDFNGDGREDFLWRNASGQTVIWHMNGAVIQSSGATSVQVGTDWSVVGVGDTNGDGRDDILFQRASDGLVAVWAMNGTTVSSATNIASANPSDWAVRGVGDYNGDGRDDVLWQHDNGLVYVWLLDGGALVGGGGLSGVGAEWTII
jgi:hypothetical protein